MSTGLIIAIIVAAFVAAVLIGIAVRQRRERGLQGRRVEASEQRDQASVEAAQAQRAGDRRGARREGEAGAGGCAGAFRTRRPGAAKRRRTRGPRGFGRPRPLAAHE